MDVGRGSSCSDCPLPGSGAVCDPRRVLCHSQVAACKTCHSCIPMGLAIHASGERRLREGGGRLG